MGFWRALGLTIILATYSLLLTAGTTKDPFDVYIDIDWTTVYSHLSSDATDDVVEYENKRYRITDGFGQFIYTLAKNFPNIRISFYSGEGAERNEAVLKSIKLPDGQTAFDIADRVLSKAELFDTGAGDHFADRYKKRIRRFVPKVDYTRAILIDDIIKFADDGIPVLYSHGKYNFYENFENYPVDSTWSPDRFELWKRERMKVAYWLGVIALLQKTDQPIANEVKRFNDVRFESSEFARIQAIGLSMMKKTMRENRIEPSELRGFPRYRELRAISKERIKPRPNQVK